MVGQTILHYRLVEKLGAGGMGEIYKAEDSRLNRMVAIKLLSPRFAADQERRKRFFQEARAASALNHPNIITLYDIVSEDDVQCIVMEYVAGKTLREVIPPRGLNSSQALQYGIQMAGALGAAHSAGIIHRDLKPSNVMITNSGLIKILDFGLAKWIDPSLTGHPAGGAAVDQGLTTEGSIIGTVSYMSPEQAIGKRVDTRSDIFSFGCVLYEMVTGRRAFEGSSGISTLSSILRDDVKPIGELAPDVPEALEQVILKCLAKEPDARWQSMKEIEGRLAAVERQPHLNGHFATPVASKEKNGAASGKPPAPSLNKSSGKPAAVRPRSSAVLMWGLLGAVLIASALIGGWWLWRGQPEPPGPSSERMVVPAPTAEPPAAGPAPAEPTPEPAPAPPAAETSTPASKSVVPRKSPAKPSAFGNAVPPHTPQGPNLPSASPSTRPPAQALIEPPPPAPPQTPSRPPIPLIPVKVSDGLPFRIVLAEDVPADAAPGKALRFTVADNVRIGDSVVIPKGAIVSGVVAHPGKKKFLVVGGRKATFELQQVAAIDGKKLHARSTSGRPAGEPATRAFETAKGSRLKGLVATQGTEYVGYIDGDQTVSVSK